MRLAKFNRTIVFAINTDHPTKYIAKKVAVAKRHDNLTLYVSVGLIWLSLTTLRDILLRQLLRLSMPVTDTSSGRAATRTGTPSSPCK